MKCISCKFVFHKSWFCCPGLSYINISKWSNLLRVAKQRDVIMKGKRMAAFPCSECISEFKQLHFWYGCLRNADLNGKVGKTTFRWIPAIRHGRHSAPRNRVIIFKLHLCLILQIVGGVVNKEGTRELGINPVLKRSNVLILTNAFIFDNSLR